MYDTHNEQTAVHVYRLTTTVYSLLRAKYLCPLLRRSWVQVLAKKSPILAKDLVLFLSPSQLMQSIICSSLFAFDARSCAISTGTQCTVFPLLCPRWQHLYHIQSPHPPRHPMRAAVTRYTIKSKTMHINKYNIVIMRTAEVGTSAASPSKAFCNTI
jgi:hypothetical protein